MSSSSDSNKKRGFYSKIKHAKAFRFVAFTLATVLGLSAFSANISSIVNLLTAAAISAEVAVMEQNNTYYDATLDLYDYFSDDTSKNTYPDYARLSEQTFSVFNEKLKSSSIILSGLTSYVTKAGSYDEDHPSLSVAGSHYPLYLGPQSKGSYAAGVDVTDGDAQSISDSRYSLAVNSKAGASVDAAVQNLVDATLVDGRITQGDGAIFLPYFYGSWLDSKYNSFGRADEGNLFKFKKKTSGIYSGYYVYDSYAGDGLIVTDKNKSALSFNSSTLMKSDTKKIYYTDNGASAGYAHDENDQNAFLPLGEGNYGFGAKFEIDFQMSRNGINPTTGEPFTFEFTGGDDVWIFIDDKLVLDLGGVHDSVSGVINFAQKTTYVSAVVNESALRYDNALEEVGDNVTQNVTESVANILNGLGLYSDPSRTHKMSIFYLERGRGSSNCRIAFNFEQYDTLTVKNVINMDNVNDFFKEETKNVVQSEGIEYLMVNDGAATAGSLDDGANIGLALEENYGTSIATATVTYFKTTNDTQWTQSGQSTCTVGARTPLKPSSTRTGYQFKGWATNLDDAAMGKATYAGTTSGAIVTVTGDMNLYEVWVERPCYPLAGVVMGASGAFGITSPTSGYALALTENDKDALFCNYTYLSDYKLTPVKRSGKNYVEATWTESGNKRRYPYASQWFTDYTGDKTKNENTLTAKGGWLYLYSADDGVDSKLYKYSYSAAANDMVIYDPNSAGYSDELPNDIKDWFIAYSKLYDVLTVAMTEPEADAMSGSEWDAFRAQYASSLNVYKNAAYTTDDSDLTNAAAALNNLIPAGSRLILTDPPIRVTDPGATPASLSALPSLEFIEPQTDEPQTTQTQAAQQETTETQSAESAEPETTDPDISVQSTTEPNSSDPDSTEPESVEPVTGGAPISGSNAIGHWAGSTSSYAPVTGTNFRLRWIDGNYSVVRQTREDNEGRFNLLGNQEAKFTTQFTRGSHLKLAQTGHSYRFSDITVGTDNTSDTLFGGSSAMPLSSRYDTSWTITDSKKITSDDTAAVIADSDTGVSIYSAHKYENGDDAGSFLMDYVGEQASNANDFVDVTVTYENTVKTSDLYVTSKVDEDGLAYIKAYNANGYNSRYNQRLKFNFQVTFSNVFSGGSEEELFTGTYYVKCAENWYVRDNGMSSSIYELQEDGFHVVDTYNNNQVSSGVSKITWSDLARTATNGTIPICEDETFIIFGIPVGTEYKLTQILRDTAEKQGDWFLSGVVVSSQEDETGTSQNDVELEPDVGTVQQGNYTKITNTLSGKIRAVIEGTADAASQLLGSAANGYANYLAGYTPYETNPSEYIYTFTNNTDKAIIVLYNEINHLYYYNGDNPSGLASSTQTVGGLDSASYDKNGYERATEAEQSFIYRITEYKITDSSLLKISTSNFTDENLAEIEEKYATGRVFYEVISFPKGDIDLSKENFVKKREKLIRVDVDKQYKIEQLTDWSWKYELDGTPSVYSGSDYWKVPNGVFIHSFDIGSNTQKNVETANGIQSVSTANFSYVHFKNSDRTAARDIEGDTGLNSSKAAVQQTTP